MRARRADGREPRPHGRGRSTLSPCRQTRRADRVRATSSSAASRRRTSPPIRPRALAELAATAFEHLSAPRQAERRRHPPHRPRGRAQRPPPRHHGRSRSSTTTCRSCSIRPSPRSSSRATSRVLVAHPILAVERDAAGALVRLVGEATAAAPDGARRESFIQIHLDRIDDAAARERLVEGLRRVYADVAVAVRDWAAMRARIAEAIDDLPREPAAAAAGRGRRGDRLPRLDRRRQLHLPRRAGVSPAGGRHGRRPGRRGSGLGLMRDPAVKVLRRGGELVVDDARDPRLPRAPEGAHHHQGERQVARAPPRPSRLYRRRSCSRARGGSKGSCASSACSPRAPTRTSPARSPISATRSRRSSRGAGFDPASYAGRALLNVLENYPRDELFQIDEDTLYRFAIEIMNLSERPRMRALARLDEFDRFVSVLVFVPKDRYDTSGAPAHRRLPRGVFKGRVSAAYPAYPGRAARRAPITSSAATRARRRRSRRQTLEAGIAAIVRTWGDALATALAEPIGGQRARALAARYADAFSGRLPRGLRRRARDRATSTILERLSAERPRAVDLYRREGDPDTRINLKVFSRGAALPLSERVPLLENLGFRVVNERTYRVLPAGSGDAERVWLHDMALERAAGGADRHRQPSRGRSRRRCSRVFRGLAEIRRLQPARARGRPRLARRRDAARRSAATCARSGSPSRRIYLADTLARHPAIAIQIVELFYARFDPRRDDSEPRRARGRTARRHRATARRR